jgi:hypothetical protein
MGFNFCEGFSLKIDLQTPKMFFKKQPATLLKLPIFWLGIFEINSELLSIQMM